MTPARGEIWWVALDPVVGSEIAKTRPALVLTADVLNQLRRTVIVIPLSSSPAARPPLTVRVNFAGKPAVAVIDRLRAVSKERLRERIGLVSAVELVEIERAVRRVLDLG